MGASKELAVFDRLAIDLGNNELNKTSLAIQGSLVERFVTRYELVKREILEASKVLDGDLGPTIQNYLIDKQYSRLVRFVACDDAIRELTEDSWRSLIRETAIYDVMPDKRREEWDAQKEWVEFTLDNVVSTLFALLQEQGKFTAEKVDNCFNRLSKSHVTNVPQGFYKRAIFSYSHNKGVLHDLRYVIAKLMQRETIGFGYHDTNKLLENIPQNGEWHEIDGGALKIRKYLIGTAHVQFHEDTAWQLNSILATIHGAAIPESFKRKPQKEPKQKKIVEVYNDLLPFSILNLLQRVERYRFGNSSSRTVHFSYGYNMDKHQLRHAESILELLGGAKNPKLNTWTFDYDVLPVLQNVIQFGQVPNKKSHQHYPTNQFMAAEAAAWLGAKEGDDCLEPQAGSGALASFLPKETTTLVEISAVFCNVLKSMMFSNIHEMDFLKFAAETSQRFDKILMNPPFSEKRAETHLLAALTLLKPKGDLVAILPLSARNYVIPNGFHVEYSSERHNQFEGTSISVIMLKITKQ